MVGAISEQDIAQSFVSHASNIPNSIQGTVLSALPESVRASTALATSAEINSGFDQMQSQLTSLQQYAQIGAISMGFVGIGLLTYGGLAKKKPKLKTEDVPLDIIKKRLAKGKITKKEFDNLKKDIQ